jgi:hypothetical protein
MIAASHSQRSNEYQIGMGFFLLASGASQVEFEVLQHAGLVTSYPTTLRQLKKLSDERMDEIQCVVRSRPFLLLWDNLNFAFKVAEQRKGSKKSTFESGTTSTIVLLHDVEFGELNLDLLPPVHTTRPYFEFSESDLRPSPKQMADLEAAMIWHIRDMFLTLYPALRESLGDSIPALPETDCITPHKTEFYILPATNKDESTLEGTMDFLEEVFHTHLKFGEEDIKRHGIIMGAGDLLSNLLAEKVTL